MKLITFILLLFTVPSILFAQSNIQVTVYQNDIKVNWDFDASQPPVMNWMVCYAQSPDTAGFRHFNIMDGAPYEDMWPWFVYYGPYNFATVWNKSFLFEEDGVQGYIKLGVLGQLFDSTWLPAKTFGPFPAGTLGTPQNVSIQ